MTAPTLAEQIACVDKELAFYVDEDHWRVRMGSPTRNERTIATLRAVLATLREVERQAKWGDPLKWVEGKVV